MAEQRSLDIARDILVSSLGRTEIRSPDTGADGKKLGEFVGDTYKPIVRAVEQARDITKD